jgi:hypothetical protein
LGTDFKLSATRPIKNRLSFEVQSQRIKIKINFLPHLSQALGTDFKLSATRPIKNSSRFEDQSQRLKVKINFFTSFEPSLGHRIQALGNKTNKKQLEV